MPRKIKKLLKYFLILLFSFEILAPAFIQLNEKEVVELSNQTHFVDLHGSFDCLAQLFFEENNSEERESKDYDLTYFYFIEIFNELEKFQSLELTCSNPKERVDSQPSLYTRHRVLLI